MVLRRKPKRGRARQAAAGDQYVGYGLPDVDHVEPQAAEARIPTPVPDPPEAPAAPEPAELAPAARRPRSRKTRLLAIGVATGGVLLVAWLTFELIAAHRLIGTLTQRIELITAGKPDRALPELRDVQVEYGWTHAGTRATEIERRLLASRLREVEGLLSAERPERAIAELLSLREVLTSKSDLARIDHLRARATAEIPAARLFERINVAHPERRDLAAFDQLTHLELMPFLLERVDREQGVLPHARERVLDVLRRIDDPRSVPKVVGVYLDSADPKVRVVAGEVLRAAGKKGGVAGVRGVGNALAKLREARDGAGGGHEAVARAERARRALDWLVGAGIEPAGKPGR